MSDRPRGRRLWPLLRIIGRRDWLRGGVRNRLIAPFAWPGSGHAEVETTLHGARYLADVNDHIDWKVYFFGGYEKRELAELVQRARCASGAVFVDIGATHGLYTLSLAPHCARVIAFEPFEPVRRRLEAHIALNGLTHVEVHPAALGDQAGERPFFPPDDANMAEGSFVQPLGPRGDRPPTTATVHHGDDYLAGLDLDRLDLLKVDVEGMEKEVMAGLRGTLERFRPVVLLEFTRDFHTSYTGLEDLRAALPDGYRILSLFPDRVRWKVLLRPGHGWQPFAYPPASAETNLLLLPAQ